ncbi:glycosyl hydrolase family 18 protein [Embleya hyalina]|uniref:chitinase n=1 Tax=Embleya hyalina TaxID=516124 RepID=A0A401YMT0_9ACTN|nr:glycosyl hydrolase family 18 protein [Embleya hyalina]GCD95933.1 chitinase [Embleya hyalina]
MSTGTARPVTHTRDPDRPGTRRGRLLIALLTALLLPLGALVGLTGPAHAEGTGGSETSGWGRDRPPTAPGRPHASHVTDTSVNLSWRAARDDRGVRNYDVLRDGVKVATVRHTSYVDRGLNTGTGYTYTVVARDTRDQVGPASAPAKVRTTGEAKVKLGYFTNWGPYLAKNIDTSGTARNITHINYAFGNVVDGKCVVGDPWADYQRPYTAADSVDGVADTAEQPLKGHFNQLRELKKKYPNLKILYSFGGWTWSGGFTEAVRNPAAFAESCHSVVEDPRWADVFDGIDLDWEYPNACGLTCDASGFESIKTLLDATRARFGAGNLVTAAITADAAPGGKLDVADYGGASGAVDWYNVMTYDFFGSWMAQGPTAPHSPLTSYPGIPVPNFNSADAIAKLRTKGVPAKKLLLGIPFYGHGWTGVTQSEPGGTATAPASGDGSYRALKVRCPATGMAGGTSYGHCGNEWWGYDTPASLAVKTKWAKEQKLSGAFFWELSGDTENGELAAALNGGLG